MFFELSKLLNFFLSPITWVILLLILSLVLKRKTWRWGCRIACICVFLIFTNGLLVEYMKYLRVKEYSYVRLDEQKHYRMVVVMGGFATMNRETGQMRYVENRADRLWEAVRLWKMGKTDRILITGDPTSMIDEKDGSSTTDLFLRYMDEMGVPDSVFVLEQHARNSQENAIYTAARLKKEGIREADCLLITSATHMQRSLKCFAKVGLHPDYYPVNTYDPPRNINHRAFYPNWKAAVEWQELINEWIGERVYKVLGYN